MLFLYDISIYFYAFCVKVLSQLGNKKAQLWLAGRANWEAELSQIKFQKPVLWMHCASLGEFEQGRPILEILHQKNPNVEILLTFYSPSGYEIRKNYPLAHHVCYLPLDSKKNAEKFLEITQPHAAIFVKYEFWLHFLIALKSRKINTYLVSAIFRPKQIFFRWYGKLFLEILKDYEHIFVQNKSSLDILQKNNIVQNVTLAGDTRVDRVLDLAKNAQKLSLIDIFSKNNKIFIAGSTWQADEKILLPFFQNIIPQGWKVIIAPHEIDEKHLQNICKHLKNNYLKYSEANENNIAEPQILLIDNIGMLASLYQYATVAYIGGGFGAGIHNTLEPMSFKLPVIFGTKYQKFEEANWAVEHQAAFSIQNISELQAAFDLLQDTNQYQTSAAAAFQYLQKNSGATEKIIAYLHTSGDL